MCHNENSQFASIFLSILIFSLSLSVNFNQLETKAFKYHECGRKVRRLLNELSLSKDESAIENIVREYDNILDKYENHTSLDYYQFILENSKKLTSEQSRQKPPWYILYLVFPVSRYVPQLFFYTITVALPMWILLNIVKF